MACTVLYTACIIRFKKTSGDANLNLSFSKGIRLHFIWKTNTFEFHVSFLLTKCSEQKWAFSLTLPSQRVTKVLSEKTEKPKTLIIKSGVADRRELLPLHTLQYTNIIQTTRVILKMFSSNSDSKAVPLYFPWSYFHVCFLCGYWLCVIERI